MVPDVSKVVQFLSGWTVLCAVGSEKIRWHWFVFYQMISLLLITTDLLKIIYLNWRLITLQYCSGFCHTSTWISHGCTCVPHPEPPSHLPPNPIPHGHRSSSTLSTLSHASNLDWWSISHMIIYVFQCYSLKSSTLAFSHRVQKSVLYICVSFAVSHIGSSLPSF